MWQIRCQEWFFKNSLNFETRAFSCALGSSGDTSFADIISSFYWFYKGSGCLHNEIYFRMTTLEPVPVKKSILLSARNLRNSVFIYFSSWTSFKNIIPKNQNDKKWKWRILEYRSFPFSRLSHEWFHETDHQDYLRDLSISIYQLLLLHQRSEYAHTLLYWQKL